jgi:serine/threonine protein kinase
MEFVEGETLKNFIFRQESHRCDEQAFLKLAKQILAAVAHAHEAGVIHRDLKPQNVMLTASGSVRVMDFGIAANIKETLSRTTSGFIAFSPLYASPEQIQGSHPQISMDMYSLGCMFYEMLTGQPPFCRGNIEYQQLHVEPKPMEGVSSRLNEAILRCLVKDPRKRCRDVQALQEMLSRKREPVPSARRALVAVLTAIAVVVIVGGGYGIRYWTKTDPLNPEKTTSVGATKTDPPPRSLQPQQPRVDAKRPDPRKEVLTNQSTPPAADPSKQEGARVEPGKRDAPSPRLQGQQRQKTSAQPDPAEEVRKNQRAVAEAVLHR